MNKQLNANTNHKDIISKTDAFHVEHLADFRVDRNVSNSLKIDSPVQPVLNGVQQQQPIQANSRGMIIEH